VRVICDNQKDGYREVRGDIDESMLSTAPEDCLRNFPNLKEIRKEQKTKLGS